MSYATAAAAAAAVQHESNWARFNLRSAFGGSRGPEFGPPKRLKAARVRGHESESAEDSDSWGGPNSIPPRIRPGPDSLTGGSAIAGGWL